MGESLVGLGHLVHILATLYGVTAVVGSVENLTRQTVSHGALGALAGKLDQPAQRQSLTTLGADFDRHLVSGTADAADFSATVAKA